MGEWIPLTYDKVTTEDAGDRTMWEMFEDSLSLVLAHDNFPEDWVTEDLDGRMDDVAWHDAYGRYSKEFIFTNLRGVCDPPMGNDTHL